MSCRRKKRLNSHSQLLTTFRDYSVFASHYYRMYCTFLLISIVEHKYVINVIFFEIKINHPLSRVRCTVYSWTRNYGARSSYPIFNITYWNRNARKVSSTYLRERSTRKYNQKTISGRMNPICRKCYPCPDTSPNAELLSVNQSGTVWLKFDF